MRPHLLVLLLALTAVPAAHAESAGIRYLATVQGNAGFALGANIPGPTRAFIPGIGGAFGVRFVPKTELHLEFAHSFVGTSSDDSGGSLNQLGLRLDYSPAEFENAWFYQVRAGWVSSSLPFSSSSGDRLFVGAGIGYSLELGKVIDLRPVATLQITPVETSSGGQVWPLASVGLQLVSKTDQLADFLLSFFSGYHSL